MTFMNLFMLNYDWDLQTEFTIGNLLTKETKTGTFMQLERYHNERVQVFSGTHIFIIGFRKEED